MLPWPTDGEYSSQYQRQRTPGRILVLTRRRCQPHVRCSAMSVLTYRLIVRSMVRARPNVCSILAMHRGLRRAYISAAHYTRGTNVDAATFSSNLCLRTPSPRACAEYTGYSAELTKAYRVPEPGVDLGCLCAYKTAKKPSCPSAPYVACKSQWIWLIRGASGAPLAALELCVP